MTRYGWEVDDLESSRGEPVIRLRKGGQWVETYGEIGVSRQILLQRALIEALEIDLSRSQSPAERAVVDAAWVLEQKRDALGRQYRQEALWQPAP